MKRIWAIFFALFLLLFGVATSHAALYFPHFDTTTNGWQTEICVINPSATDLVAGTLEIYSTNGTKLGTTDPLYISPNQRLQFNVGTEWAYATNTRGYIVFKNMNTSGSPVGYTKFTQIGGDRVAVPAADNVTTGNLYVTHIAWAPWWTGISLVNTTTETKTLTIRFNTGVTRTVTLGANKQYVNTINGLLGGLLDTTIESAVIEGASGVVGLELFGQGSQLGGVPLISQMVSTLFYPHVDSTAGWWTGIVAYNPSATAAAQLAVQPYDANGNPLSSSTQSLGPGKKFIGVSTDPKLNLPSATAWFSLQSPIPLVGFELFGNTVNNNLAGYSTVNLEVKSGTFSKVEKNGGWTGIAFVNTENQPAKVTLKAYDDTGNMLGQSLKNLNAHQKLVDVAEKLFPGINLNTATYLSFSADRNVAGFQLNGSGAMLDALPAAAPSGQKIIDKALGFLQYQSTLTSGTQAVTDIIGQILGTSSGGTCPQVTVVPPLDSLTTFPPAITLTASFGNGCIPSGSTDTVSGQVVLAITNFSVSSDYSSIALDYALTATNLQSNGKVILNGAVSGHIAFANSQLNASINFDNFQVADSSISGSMTIDATNLGLSDTIDVGDMTITLNNLTAAGYTVNGTLTMHTTGNDVFQVVANLNTSQGPVNITLTIQDTGTTSSSFSTSTPGTIAGYTVTLNNVIMDSTCSNNPLAGSVTVSQGGSSVTRTFNATCMPIAGSVIVSQDGSSVTRAFTATHMPITGSVTALLEIPRQLTRVFTPRVSE